MLDTSRTHRPNSATAHDNEPPQRKATDESLAEERAKCDAALSDLAALAEVADTILGQVQVDTTGAYTLAHARAGADRARESHHVLARAGIPEARPREHAFGDSCDARPEAALRSRRAATAELLAHLIPLQRGRTDQALTIERARADDALANRDAFLGIVSHDLRSLLCATTLSAQIITAQGAEEDRAQQTRLAAERIKRASLKMSRLISDLLDVSSIEAGKLTIALKVTDGSDLVTRAAELWGGCAKLHGIRLEVTTMTCVQVNVDPERMLQVLGNRITNALKFSPKGSTVEIGLARVGRVARFTVKDSGRGISHDEQSLIFERFWQRGNSEHGSLGLGLYIAKCIVEAHGGAIWVESTPGTGSEFFFTVPCA